MTKDVDAGSLLASVSGREVHAPPLGHFVEQYDGPETRAAVKARDEALPTVRAFAGRVDEIRKSRLLTHHERATLRPQAADKAIAALKPSQALIVMNRSAADRRKAALRPASGGYESDATLGVDLQLLARYEAMSDEQRNAFFVALAGEPTKLEVRLGEAVIRTGLLGSVKPADWTRVHDAVFEFKNRQALTELRAISAATGQAERFVAQVRDAVEGEVALERSRAEPAPVGMIAPGA